MDYIREKLLTCKTKTFSNWLCAKLQFAFCHEVKQHNFVRAYLSLLEIGVIVTSEKKPLCAHRAKLEMLQTDRKNK